MAIVVAEKYKGRTLDATSAEVLYLVTGTDADAGNVDDGDAFDAVVGAAPTTHEGFPGANVQVREELVLGTTWLVAVLYGASSGDSIIFPSATVDYEFSYQAPAEKVNQSLETISAQSALGPISTDMFGGAINVSYSNGENTVDGLDLPPGNVTNAWVYKPLTGTVTDAYQIGVESIMGHVNRFTFKSRAAGTMRLVTCDGGASFTSGVNPKWAIRFGFQFSANRTSFTVGGISVPFKGGHHLMWGYYHPDFWADEGDDENNGVITTPKFIFVERVFEESNFSVLGIG